MTNAMTDDLPNEETNSPDFADHRNYYKVEKMDQGRQQNRPDALCWQESEQGARHIRHGR
jgi:hypothetical protein